LINGDNELSYKEFLNNKEKQRNLIIVEIIKFFLFVVCKPFEKLIVKNEAETKNIDFVYVVIPA
jgi:hypothetical protein